MAKPKIIYDPTCPICKQFVKVMRTKVTAAQMDFVPAGEHLDNIHYVDSDGVLHEGQDAIETMVIAFPELSRMAWLIPKDYRTAAMKAAYAAGSILRTIIKPKKGCNCGKR